MEMAALPIHKLLRKGLDAYETRQEQKIEKYAEIAERGLGVMEDQRNLVRLTWVLGIANGLLWLIVIVIPRVLDNVWSVAIEFDDNASWYVFVVVFGLGLSLTYALFRLKFQDLEDPNIKDDILSSFHRSEHANRRFLIWLFSVIGGLVNAVLLLTLEVYLSGSY